MTRREDDALLDTVQAWLEASESKPRLEILAGIAAICGVLLAVCVLHLGAM